MEVFSYCFMPSYGHLIFRSSNEDPSALARDFKGFTARKMIKTKSGSTIQLKKCTRPTVQTKEIYTALSLKHKPYNIKKSVVP